VTTPVKKLLQRWPKFGGEKYARAKQLCMAALGGRGHPCESAGIAFVAAAKEAELLASYTSTENPSLRSQPVK